MTSVVANAAIEGHEARGRAQLVRSDSGEVSLELTDFWVAPGAPDVQLYLATESGVPINDELVGRSVSLGRIPDRTPEISLAIPGDVDPASLASVIIYCTAYSVLFGSGDFA